MNDKLYDLTERLYLAIIQRLGIPSTDEERNVFWENAKQQAQFIIDKSKETQTF